MNVSELNSSDYLHGSDRPDYTQLQGRVNSPRRLLPSAYDIFYPCVHACSMRPFQSWTVRSSCGNLRACKQPMCHGYRSTHWISYCQQYLPVPYEHSSVWWSCWKSSLEQLNSNPWRLWCLRPLFLCEHRRMELVVLFLLVRPTQQSTQQQGGSIGKTSLSTLLL